MNELRNNISNIWVHLYCIVYKKIVETNIICRSQNINDAAFNAPSPPFFLFHSNMTWPTKLLWISGWRSAPSTSETFISDVVLKILRLQVSGAQKIRREDVILFINRRRIIWLTPTLPLIWRYWSTVWFDWAIVLKSKRGWVEAGSWDIREQWLLHTYVSITLVCTVHYVQWTLNWSFVPT